MLIKTIYISLAEPDNKYSTSSGTITLKGATNKTEIALDSKQAEIIAAALFPLIKQTILPELKTLQLEAQKFNETNGHHIFSNVQGDDSAQRGVADAKDGQKANLQPPASQ